METLVNVDVPDLEAAIEFYRNATELTFVRRLFDGTVAELAADSVRIFLLQQRPGSAPVPDAPVSRDYRRHWTPVHLDFVVPDLESAVAKALAAGARLERPIEGFAWGRQAVFGDPFGHGFCLLQWQGGGYDEVAVREAGVAAQAGAGSP
ncbi:MAG TPA: VOC family protein [Zeimonas sp.]|nr:VOC family protein [Zeimonas sp.]